MSRKSKASRTKRPAQARGVETIETGKRSPSNAAAAAQARRARAAFEAQAARRSLQEELKPIAHPTVGKASATSKMIRSERRFAAPKQTMDVQAPIRSASSKAQSHIAAFSRTPAQHDDRNSTDRTRGPKTAKKSLRDEIGDCKPRPEPIKRDLSPPSGGARSPRLYVPWKSRKDLKC